MLAHVCGIHLIIYIMTMTTRRISIIFNFLGHYKYLIVVVLGCIMVGFVDDNSMLRRLQLQMQIADLQEEIEKYGLDLVGVLPQDETVYEYDCDGKPSSQVPDSTPVKQALHQIMRDLNL